MKKRYIVLLDKSTKEQNDQFLNYLRKHRLGWWHWLTNSWLLSDSAGTLSASIIRDEVKRIYGGVNHFVIELRRDGEAWSGFGPKAQKRNMFTWIHRNWKNI
jgi:hypothetical protein